ncbi:MAG: PH domain-containing protein [Cyanobacteria bacterium]|nr:PH domain-containing protein [Cyanobacteriota bacterium]
MAPKVSYAAPWSNALLAISTLATVLLLAIVVLGLLVGPRSNPWWIGSMVVMPLAILLFTASRSVRGYCIEGDRLYIQRPVGHKTIALAPLQAALVNPQAMDRSIRIWGNGGLFSFSGFFHNPQLGQYQAYVTDKKRTVVLTFPTHKLVLSPADPEGFVATVLQARTHG